MATHDTVGDTDSAEENVDVESILTRAQDSITVRRVFGEPIERDGVLVIPAAAVRGGGGGGGGGGSGPEGTGTGSGAGFGVAARPVGAFVIRDGEVDWRPAVDPGRLALGAFALAAIVVLAVRSVLVRRS
jgi:uncharacterized spore protein YtfJ